MLAFSIDSKTITQFGAVWEECAGEKGEGDGESGREVRSENLLS